MSNVAPSNWHVVVPLGHEAVMAPSYRSRVWLVASVVSVDVRNAEYEMSQLPATRRSPSRRLATDTAEDEVVIVETTPNEPETS